MLAYQICTTFIFAVTGYTHCQCVTGLPSSEHYMFIYSTLYALSGMRRTRAVRRRRRAAAADRN